MGVATITATVAYRAQLVHWLGDPHSRADAMQHFADGVLLVDNGKVAALGPAETILPKLGGDVAVHHYPDKLLMPGLVDTHIHYAQSGVIASYGEQLLSWLEKYTFPAERACEDAEYAAQVAESFLDELLRNGTTTALAFATVHPASADAIFHAAQQRHMRLIAGKVLMDRNCPDYLRDSAASGYAQSRQLIEKWHGQDRLLYAVTPRFAPTSTPQQMQLAGELFRAHPGVYLQSHLAENPSEVAWVGKLYPHSRSYLDVYDTFDQLGARSVFAHCIWLDEQDRQRMAASGAAMSFCPTSNLFLGSGLFDLAAADQAGVRVGIGSDVGGGTSFSLLQTLAEGYKVLQLRGQSLTASRAFYLATLGGAHSLYLDDTIGNFVPGKEADFVLLNPAATPLMRYRTGRCQSIDELLFALMMLGDDRTVHATAILGKLAWQSETAIRNAA